MKTITTTVANVDIKTVLIPLMEKIYNTVYDITPYTISIPNTAILTVKVDNHL